MPKWETLIDEAAQMCGSQNALALRLGCSSTNMSKARNGKQPLNAAKIDKLAELLGREPAELWESQEIANMPRRNPFRRSVATAASALTAVILSGLAPADSLAATTDYARSPAGDALYIVAH